MASISNAGKPIFVGSKRSIKRPMINEYYGFDVLETLSETHNRVHKRLQIINTIILSNYVHTNFPFLWL